MSTSVIHPKIGVPVHPGTLPISKGGTGATTAQAAVVALGGIDRNKIGQASGVFQLDANSQIPTNQIPPNVTSEVTVSGPVQVTVGASSTFTITNYDVNTNYILSVSEGTVSRTGDTITVVAPSVTNSSTLVLTINSRSIPLNLSTSVVVKPSIVVPVNNSGNHGADVAFTSSAFSSLNAETHSSSDWQISTVTDFSILSNSSTADTVNKTSWTATGLVANTTYYARVRYKSNNNIYSDWSDTLTFVTVGVWSASLLRSTLDLFGIDLGSSYGEEIKSTSLSGDGNTLVLCVHNVAGNRDNCLYVFKRSVDGFTLLQTIRDSNLYKNAIVNYTGTVIAAVATYGGNRVRVFRNATPSASGWTDISAQCFSSSTGVNSTYGDISLSFSDHQVDSELILAIGSPYADSSNPSFRSEGGRVSVYRTTSPANASEVKFNTYTLIEAPNDLGALCHFGMNVTLTPNGDKLVVSTDVLNKTVYVYSHNVSTGAVAFVTTFNPAINGSNVKKVSHISPDGNYIAFATYDQNVYVYKLVSSTYTLYSTINLGPNNPNSLDISTVVLNADGSKLFVGLPGNIDTVNGGSVVNVGKVVVYKNNNGFVYENEIRAVTLNSGGAFGSQISYSNATETLIVTEPAYRKVHVYSKNTYTSFIPSLEIAKLLASDGASNDVFGWSVSISADGNTAIVGAHNDASPVTYTGSAYIFTKSGSTWTQQNKLLANDGEGGDFFGHSVSISSDGNTAIAGAHRDNNDTGSAYIFTRSGSSWSQQAKLIAVDQAAGDQFGASVSISSDGSTAIVGAWQDGSGSAYVFIRSGSAWSQQAKIAANDGASGDNFGRSVSISADGNTAMVGAANDDNSKGSAYIFTRSGSSWSQQAKVAANDGVSSDLFGYSVSISADGNTAIAGAYGDDVNRGSAYIFTRSGSSWSQQAKLLANDGAASDSFGYSVAISSNGNTVIIGSSADDGSRGSVYIFTRSGSTWTQQNKLLANDGANNDNFGYSVSISSDGNTAIAGAYGDDVDRGSAYIFA